VMIIALSACSGSNSEHLPKDRNLPGLITQNAMVVSAHPLASKVGVEIMKNGGNAVDAAIAVQFALAVTHPSAGNIGGGGFMVYRSTDSKVDVLDFREEAPSKAFRDMYLDSLGNIIDGLSTAGHLAVGVPGSVAGMEAAHSKYGSMSWQSLLQPAIDLARNGFTLTEMEANGLNSGRERFITYSTIKPEFLDRDFKEGDSIKWPDLASTLQRIAEQKSKGFYEGETADLIVAEMERGGGWITHDDLKAYEAKWRDPIISHYKDYRIIGMPPVSSGGVALAQLMEMVEPYPIRDWGWQSSKTTHLMIEAERRVYADRATHLGDPDFFRVPVHGLIDSMYLLGRMNDFDMTKASVSDSINAGTPVPKESEQTTHFSIIDPEGNAVSITTTLNTGYGCKVLVGGAGFFLNNEMDDFSSKPGVPNYFGLVGGEANAIQGGKRMLSSMTPTILEKKGELFMVVGTPGGSTIITSVFQTILNVVEHDFTMQGAVSAPRFHHQWKPNIIRYQEGAFASSTQQELKEMGHELSGPRVWGRVDAILVRPDGSLEGGADPRGDDTAMGF